MIFNIRVGIEVFLAGYFLIHQGSRQQTLCLLLKLLHCGSPKILNVNDTKVQFRDLFVERSHEQSRRQVLGLQNLLGVGRGCHSYLAVVEMLDQELKVLLNMHDYYYQQPILDYQQYHHYTMPSLTVKIGIVIAGLVLYFFAISALLNIRRDKSEQKVLFDSIDYNRDGVLTTNQINTFKPCTNSNNTNLVARLHTLGPRVSYEQFENDVSRNMIKSTIAPCAANADLLASPTELSKRRAQNAVAPFFRLYDLDEDGIVTWNEYNLVNKYHGKTIKGASDTFGFIDKNNDWEISRQQFLAANLVELDPQLVSASQPRSAASPNANEQRRPAGGARDYENDPRGPSSNQPLDRDYYDPYADPAPSRQRSTPSRSQEPPRDTYRPQTDPYYEPRGRRYQADPQPRRQYQDSAYYEPRDRYYDQGL